jgi:hypothetical protein
VARLAGKVRVNYNGNRLERTLAIKKPSGKLTGRVVIQEQASQLPLSKVEVAIGPEISYFAVSGPDGALMMADVYEGLYQLGYIRGLPADTFVQSVTQGSRNAFFERVVIDSSDDSSLEVVVRAGAGVLTGKVIDAEGAGVHNALVALVPEKPLKDRKDYYGAYKDMRTDQNGGFEIRGITPGSYQAYAWRQIPATAFRNEEFMKPFSGKGIPIQIEINEKETIQLEAL